MLTFEIVDLPSGGMLFKGRLTQKKLAAKAKRQVFLCFPSSVQDVDVLHQHLKLQHQGEMTDEMMEEMTNKDMEMYGHLALSCISGFPLFVVGTNARNFIHFSQIQGLYDEQDLKSACSFAIITNQSEYRFFAGTSTDYQKWVGALTRAYESSQGRQPVEQYRPMTPMSEVSGPQRTMSMMSRDPEEYVEQHRVMSINRSRSQNPPERRRSFSFTNRESLGSLQAGNRSQSDLRAPPKRKKSFVGKIKSFFSGEKMDEVDDREERGRSHDNFASKLRRRSKSVTRFLFGKDDQ